MDGGSNQVAINGLQVGLPVKHDVGGVLGFVQAPMIGLFDVLQNRTVVVGEFLQLAMQLRWIPTIRQFLCASQASILVKGIVQQRVGDVVPLQLSRQPVAPVAVELQPERTPCRRAHVTQTQLLIDEIEVLVQTLAVVRPEIGPMRLLVVPRLIGGTRLQR